MVDDAEEKKQGLYKALIEKIFFAHYKDNARYFEFEREELVNAAQDLSLKLPKNLGDVIYSIRYRSGLPDSIMETQPKGMQWIIEGKGRSKYAFTLIRSAGIAPNPDLAVIKIPDATPEIVSAYALSDEQALLAKVRYNRLVDVFLGIVAYSLQSHLRTAVNSIGQVEIDEIYVALDKKGRQFVLPVQAKGRKDQLSFVQTRQDMACCAEKYPDLICRPISVQFMEGDRIALFELEAGGEEVKIIEERHYELVPADAIGAEELAMHGRYSR